MLARRSLQLLLLTACAITAGCTQKMLPPGALEDQDHRLTWLPDGSALVIDARWWFDPTHGTFQPLQCATGEGRLCTRQSFEAVGTQYIVVDSQKMAIASPAARGPWQRIPRWLPDDAGPASADEIANVAFWIAPGTIYVQQFYADGHGTPECRVREVRGADAQWRRPPGGCVEGGLGHLAHVDRGPAGLLALHSSSEGYSDLILVRYAEDSGSAQTSIASLVIEGASSMQVRFAQDGSRIDVISPCTLAATSSASFCDGTSGQLAWKLYSVPASGGELQLQRADLPPGTVADPQRDRFAWVRDGALCLGDPGAADSRCVKLPG